MAFHDLFFLQELSSLLSPYKKACDTLIHDLWRGQTELDRACVYGLQTGGKRFRPALVWMMQEARGVDWKANPGPGLACEYFHTSSLIADDSPCMDNDDFRRGKPTVHKQFSESTALLASFALVSEGFRAIAETPLPKNQDTSLASFVISEASRTMGIEGLLGGQWLDLNPPGDDPASLMAVNDKKTGALFELALLLGWIFGGGHRASLDTVRKLAHAFGRAFQLIDDIDDYEQDLKAQKKNNFAVVFGLEQTVVTARDNVNLFLQLLSDLHIENTSKLHALGSILLRALSKS